MAGLSYSVEALDDAVEFWISRRLQFCPKGEMLEALVALQAALQGLRSQPGEALLATFSSLDPEPCDIDNVLICNVVARWFSGTASTAIRLTRERCTPPKSPCGNAFAYHHSYRVGRLPPPRSDSPVCEIEFRLPPLTTSMKTHHLWWEVASAASRYSGTLTGRFELRVSIGTAKPQANLARIIKELQDGIICGMHADTNLLPEAIKRLAENRGWDAADVRTRLAQPSTPVLGKRKLLGLTPTFVQWNPADDLCEACTIEQHSGDSERCRVTVWRC